MRDRSKKAGGGVTPQTVPPLSMTANDTNDDDREKDTDAGSPERRLGEVVKQTEIVLDKLESEQQNDQQARIEELEAGILKLISENVRGNYRDLMLGAWHSMADTLEEGENPEPALWAWLFKCQEAMDLTVGDFDRAGFVERESPPYVVAFESFDLARCALAAAGTPDDRARLFDVPDSEQGALEKTMHVYRRIGQYLGEIRVDVLGELEFEGAGGQQYDAIELAPTYGRLQGNSCGIHSEPGDCESGTFEGQILRDAIQLHYGAEGDGAEWSLSFKATPDDCRDMAMMLLNMAADAEYSSTVDV